MARPEEMPVNETLALQDALRDDIGLEVDLVVCNGMLAQRFAAADARALEAAPDGPEVRAARHAHARARRPARAAAAPAPRRARPGRHAAVHVFDEDGRRVARLARELERAL